MKTNEAPKSKFVYPGKLYARTNNNITLDISYAPQNMGAVEYTRTDGFIEKACEWLEDHIYEYLKMNRTWNEPDYDLKLIGDFRNYLKE